MYVRETKKASSFFKTEGDVFLFKGLSLKYYIEACSFVCKMHHKQPCHKCCSLLKVTKTVLDNGIYDIRDIKIYDGDVDKTVTSK